MQSSLLRILCLVAMELPDFDKTKNIKEEKYKYEIILNCCNNFGSEHDPDDTLCSPGTQKGGNFIMYRRATTGTDRNNRNFSDCSRDQMGPILHALVTGYKFCFKQYNGSLCGIGIVEEGEECDCDYGTDSILA